MWMDNFDEQKEMYECATEHSMFLTFKPFQMSTQVNTCFDDIRLLYATLKRHVVAADLCCSYVSVVIGGELKRIERD